MPLLLLLFFGVVVVVAAAAVFTGHLTTIVVLSQQCEIQFLRAKITALLPGEPKQVTTACRDFDELKS
ncbi:unnamed protein product [Dibothriocephalus latus]|uniref:Secreted protein n=1 Tax=Dibothriocephalus latus TaxID=60516 RepID=A0A3P7MGL2_DIBLA|nr:unnamed protein product [Dibothriocephalus latus]